MFFAYDNLVDQATLTASSAAAGFPANNLKNSFRSKPWKTAGATAGTAQLVVDLSALWSATGSDMMNNGGFDSTPLGWTAGNCTLASVAGGDSGNCLEVTLTAGAEQEAYQDKTTVVGRLYRVTVKVKSGTSGNEAFRVLARETGGTEMMGVGGTSSGSWTGYSFYFTATQTTTRIGLKKLTATAGTMLFDTVVVYEMAGGAVEGIALTGYDWAAAPGTLQVEFANADSWGSPLATETLTWVSATTPGGNKGTIIKKLAATLNYRFARLSVVYAAGDWNLGRLFLGPVFEPDREYSWGYGEEVVDPSLISATIGGQAHADAIERYRVINCNGIILTQAQWVLYQAMINEVGKRKEFFAAFDYTNEAAERTIYGRFSKLPAIKRPFLWEYDFEFTESR